jgi:hypothetical protein
MPDPIPAGPSPPLPRNALAPPAHAGNLSFLRKQAKALLRAYEQNESTAVFRMASAIPRLRSLVLPQKRQDQVVKLADAQFVIARELGYASWPAMQRRLSTSSTSTTKAKS